MESKIVTKTILFLRIYFIFYVVASTCLTLYFGFLSLAGFMGTMAEGDEEAAIFSILFMVMGAIPILMLVLNAIAAFRVKVRSNNNWIFMLVLVCLGFLNPYTILPSILMLISLLDEDVKKYYQNPEIEADVVKVV